MSFFGNKSLDGILSSFTKVQQELSDFIVTSRKESETLRIEADRLVVVADSKIAEANKAEQVSENIQKIFLITNA